MPRARHLFDPTDVETVKLKIAALRSLGYEVKPMVPDTFAMDGLFLHSGLLANNILYSQDGFETSGIAWTSGLPLLRHDSKHLISLAVDNNLKTIALSCYWMPHGRKNPLAGLSPAYTEKVVSLIRAYNSETELERRVAISLTFTIGRHNSDADSLSAMVDYANKLDADYLRFNRLIVFDRESGLDGLMMSEPETQVFCRQLRDAACEENSITILVSSDFGTCGIRELSPDRGEAGECPGGVTSYAIYGDKIYPCDEALTEPVGELAMTRSRSGNRSQLWLPKFDREACARLSDLRNSSAYQGCIGYLLAAGR